jgi:outer membrane protein assembly factor BamB
LPLTVSVTKREAYTAAPNRAMQSRKTVEDMRYALQRIMLIQGIAGIKAEAGSRSPCRGTRFPVIAFLSLALAVGAAAARDWPEFCGSHCKDMVSEATNLPASFVPGVKDYAKGEVNLDTASNVLWGVRTCSLTYPSPTVSGGRLFTGGKEPGLGVFKCLDAATGALMWEYAEPYRKFPPEVDPGWKFMLGRITPNLGICSTATVDGDRVYLVNHRCEVLCLAVGGGDQPFVAPAPKEGAAPHESACPVAACGVRGAKVLWTFDLWDYGIRPSDACNGSPLVDGDFLYVTTCNGTDRDAQVSEYDDRKTPAPDAPNLIVLDKKTGRLLAADDAREIGPKILHGQWSTPSMGVVNGRKLIFYGGGDGVCYAFEALASASDKVGRLKTVWSFDCNPPEYKEFGGLSWAAHYSLGDRRLKKSLNKKSESSFTGMSEIIACPVFYRDRVYVAIGRDPEHGLGRGALWCIDATKTGDITRTGRIWCYQDIDRTISTASVCDGLLYLGDLAGRLHCLDAETGRRVWVHETRDEIWSSTLVADGKVYLPTLDRLWILAAGRELKVLDRIALGGHIYATPVALDGILYISSQNFLWALGKK